MFYLEDYEKMLDREEMFEDVLEQNTDEFEELGLM